MDTSLNRTEGRTFKVRICKVTKPNVRRAVKLSVTLDTKDWRNLLPRRFHDNFIRAIANDWNRFPRLMLYHAHMRFVVYAAIQAMPDMNDAATSVSPDACHHTKSVTRIKHLEYYSISMIQAQLAVLVQHIKAHQARAVAVLIPRVQGICSNNGVGKSTTWVTKYVINKHLPERAHLCFCTDYIVDIQLAVLVFGIREFEYYDDGVYSGQQALRTVRVLDNAMREIKMADKVRLTIIAPFSQLRTCRLLKEGAVSLGIEVQLLTSPRQGAFVLAHKIADSDSLGESTSRTLTTAINPSPPVYSRASEIHCELTSTQIAKLEPVLERIASPQLKLEGREYSYGGRANVKTSGMLSNSSDISSYLEICTSVINNALRATTQSGNNRSTATTPTTPPATATSTSPQATVPTRRRLMPVTTQSATPRPTTTRRTNVATAIRPHPLTASAARSPALGPVSFIKSTRPQQE